MTSIYKYTSQSEHQFKDYKQEGTEDRGHERFEGCSQLLQHSSGYRNDTRVSKQKQQMDPTGTFYYEHLQHLFESHHPVTSKHSAYLCMYMADKTEAQTTLKIKQTVAIHTKGICAV